MTLFAGDEYEGDDVTSGPVDDAGGWAGWDFDEPVDDGLGGVWDDGPDLPPSRRVMTIETTGERL